MKPINNFWLKSLVRTALFLALFTLCACNYYVSSVPITNSRKSTVNHQVLGTWKSFDQDTLRYAMKVDSLDPKRYLLNFLILDDDQLDLDVYYNYVVHHSKVGHTDYLNARILEGENKNSYYIFSYKIHGDSLTVSTIDLDEVTFEQEFESSKKFKKYIENNPQQFKQLFSPIFKFERSIEQKK